MELKIGAVARATGMNTSAIRYYEQIGLLPRAIRQRNGQRRYDEAAVRRLTFIRRCREFGFPIEHVKTLLSLAQSPDRDCREARDVATAHLQALRSKLAELHAIERSIAACIERSECQGGPGRRCAVLAQFADPARPQK